MLVLISWSFAVALVPITLALATRSVAAIAGLLDAHLAPTPPLAWHAGSNHRPHPQTRTQPHRDRPSRTEIWPDARWGR